YGDLTLQRDHAERLTAPIEDVPALILRDPVELLEPDRAVAADEQATQPGEMLRHGHVAPEGAAPTRNARAPRALLPDAVGRLLRHRHRSVGVADGEERVAPHGVDQGHAIGSWAARGHEPGESPTGTRVGIPLGAPRDDGSSARL